MSNQFPVLVKICDSTGSYLDILMLAADKWLIRADEDQKDNIRVLMDGFEDNHGVIFYGASWSVLSVAETKELVATEIPDLAAFLETVKEKQT